MTILLSVIVATILIGLVARTFLKSSQSSGYTSLGTLKSVTAPRPPLPPKQQPPPLPKPSISPQPKPTVSLQIDEPAKLRQKLLLMALGDEAVVDRLITYEQKRNPSASLIICIEAAIERWIDDHGGRQRW